MSWEIQQGDALERLKQMPDESVHCCVTSPPYWGLRDYGVVGQLGLEKTPEEYVAKMVAVFAEVRRVLRSDGTLWLNIGDSYANDGKWGGATGGKHVSALHGEPIGRSRRQTGLKPKDLVGIPWMLAFALRAEGWWLRQDIIWSKPNPMPESVTDRCTKAHEYLFLLAKSPQYFYDAEAIKEDSVTGDPRRPYGSQGAWNMDGRPDEQKHGGEPRSFKGSKFNEGKTAEHQRGRISGKVRHPAGWKSGNGSHGSIHADGREQEIKYVDDVFEKRNRRSVWEFSTQPYPEAHFATFPPKLIKPCILAGCPLDGTVLDPFAGAGTTGLVATRFGRNFIGIELNAEYCAMARKRIEHDAPLFDTADTRAERPGVRDPREISASLEYPETSDPEIGSGA